MGTLQERMLLRASVLSCLALFASAAGPPPGISWDQLPQLVMISFDDAVSYRNMPYFQKLFVDAGRNNPNGCPARPTMFVSHEYTNYANVNTLYNQGFEIADHTITQRRPQTWWTNASYDDYASEIAGQKHILHRFGGIPTSQIRGFRAPYLALGKDKMYRAINETVRVNGDVGYDSSEIQLPSKSFQPMWMHTLDHDPVTGIPAEYTCKNSPPTSCPT